MMPPAVAASSRPPARQEPSHRTQHRPTTPSCTTSARKLRNRLGGPAKQRRRRQSMWAGRCLR
eukprot:9366798-Alexandrium_andersonii.AAC.1